MKVTKGSKNRGKEGGSTRCGLDRQTNSTDICYDEDCQDIIDWSTCGYLSNIGQCALMNTLATFDVWVPCAATCGSCKLNTWPYATTLG